MSRTLQAVDVLEGERVVSVGTGDDAVSLGGALVVEHYRPFRLPSLVGLTLEDGRVIRALLHTKVTVV